MLSQHTPISKIPTQAKHLISLSTPEASAIRRLLQKKGSPTSSCHSDFKLQVGLISSISPGVLDFPFHLGALFLKNIPPSTRTILLFRIRNLVNKKSESEPMKVPIQGHAEYCGPS